MRGDRYDEDYYRANGQLGDRPALRLYERLVATYVEPTTVLDVGCGTGHLLARMARRWPSDGLELSEFSAARARRTSPTSTVWQDPAEVPDHRYDGFTAVHVLEHIPDEHLEVLLGDLRRATTAPARGLVVVPDPSGRGAQLHGERWNALRDPTHVNLKSHEQWRAYFAEHGIRVERECSDGLWDFPYSTLPRPIDAVRYGLPMAAQFLSARMMLAPRSGESSIFLVSWAD